jgi:hypothetical protein
LVKVAPNVSDRFGVFKRGDFEQLQQTNARRRIEMSNRRIRIAGWTLHLKLAETPVARRRAMLDNAAGGHSRCAAGAARFRAVRFASSIN